MTSTDAAPAGTTTADIIDALADISGGDALDAARRRRHDAREHAQGSFAAFFVPDDVTQVSLAERAAVALFVARLHEQEAAIAFYGALLRETGRDLGAGAGEALEPFIVAEAARASGQGPFGAFRAENVSESTTGPEYRVSSVDAAYALGDRLAAALEHAHLLVLHPRDGSRGALGTLLDAGWSTTGVVTISQLISFLTFQLRVVHGLGAVRGSVVAPGVALEPGRSEALAELAGSVARAAEARVAAAGGSVTTLPEHATETLPAAPSVHEPPRFTQDQLGWKSWIEPLPAADFTERHYAALVERDRVHMPYFRLLARDPEALRERTLTDLDIFHNPDAGLPRAERELAAAAASRFNGCVFCASVHARAASENGLAWDDVQRVLDEGVSARVSTRLDAVIDATVALTATPIRFGAAHLDALRDAGLDELSQLDAIQAGSFFNWANRLMLSLGEPSV
ncbi:hypothetical protein GCM10009847_22730 [Leucobacter tardus]|uniref:Alkylhydroperoxidase domain protein n=1 Tax=Leucobacter tardus TaxID=501483 RepID=A0A939QFG1_9MICO|nr:alkylhydroperoxidase domain protein [Leucobacter tardus]MBO2990213.1 alkylhydroperoxidase domain protein [Leucobacter tardus]